MLSEEPEDKPPIKVSVLIDTYNHEKYIAAALSSVLNQQNIGQAAVEIIVVDDGSSDRTGEISQTFGAAVKYHKKQNGGQASAFNMGVRLCQGEIICFLDGDDWWHPSKLSRIIEAFSENPEIVAVGNAIIEVDEVYGKEYRAGPAEPVRLNWASPKSVALFHRFSACLGTSRLAIKRSVALTLLDVPEMLVFEADEYLFTLLPAIGDLVILPEALTYYRIHGGNLYQDSRAQAQISGQDPRIVKRASVYDCLSQQLPAELRKRGCDPSVIDDLLGPVHVQASRLKLMTRGGTALENFRSEWRAAKVTKRTGTMLSKVVFWISLSLILVFPPRAYFKTRQIYGNLLKRIRHGSGAHGGSSIC